MKPIDFDFYEPEDIFDALQNCSIASVGKFTERHIRPLLLLADSLQARGQALENMVYAAQGYDDLAIILLEPADREHVLPHETILADENVPSATRNLDKSLQLAFRGKRNFQNTVVLDARPLRGQTIRDRETSDERARKDTLAYQALQESLALLQPKVVVVCHCDQDAIDDGLPEALCSSIQRAGEAQRLRLRGHEFIKVWSYHPIFIERTDIRQRPQRVMREFLFDATLVLAANALVGRKLAGFGLSNIRDSALNGAMMVFGHDGPTRSYRYISKADFTPADVIKRLRELGPEGPTDETAGLETKRSNELLKRYHREAVIFPSAPIFTSKDDPLLVFGPI
ncbi:hypothetical protein MGU_08837 [Metarhizium guizhouense ARSEF 977]|uniref:Uncharacterized protein n=1 Tax=Metarhizium guizhouense (strain ARSEF 977) TaxID=1276136 RepID=A0A0B4GAM9_METGA|nr:hypothetical protein MGU_08837 [Metarhizium guizhouense ARSEF 977]